MIGIGVLFERAAPIDEDYYQSFKMARNLLLAFTRDHDWRFSDGKATGMDGLAYFIPMGQIQDRELRKPPDRARFPKPNQSANLN